MNKRLLEISVSVRMVMIKGREIAIEQSQIPTNVRSSDRFAGKTKVSGTNGT